ncbi:phosphoribosylaminoimidazole synthetase [Halobacteroides halobius DSM 5150]|uniref:Phosphoribosylformylglycinamidine cyclo-ligase n=1 Tax=Halobacteroides halobius (strain ATCC 35273 / DSM 5150 / MD-1) TaxID=748449 RepID=L0KEG9_HALHC|nr:phosphoribosylformylglycinamidine cyclo-ligase [Halobacteroides halobius]AGB42458.1 phosphoribosylaminoimidazole synthetase [Halobacteroides halobius DSM 5150]
MGLTYKDAGVDIEAGEEAVDKLKDDVADTFTSEVLTGLGSFGALFAPDFGDYNEPVLVSGTDGVGTKLKLAFMTGQHNTVGIDLVAMSVNDILAQGARPLFFLDYLATGKLKPDSVAEVVKGITAGCKEAGCALIGGETAEMPDFYDSGEYDLAGFVVGMVDKDKIITGANIAAGDKVIGLASNGIHSNGYTLARKVFFDVAGYDVEDQIEGLETTLGEELLKPTRIYVQPVLEILEQYQVNGIAHITGGGLIENLPRILPDDLQAVIDQTSWPTQTIFNLMQDIGDIAEREMYRTFNMGVGMTLVVPAAEAADVVKQANELGEKAYVIGEVQESAIDNGKLTIDN